MEQDTSVSFTLGSAKTVKLVTSVASKKIKIDGTSYTTDSNGTYSIELSAGTHTITKGDTMNLGFIIVGEEASVAVTGVTLDKTEVTLKMGATTSATLVATVAPSNATNKNVSWSSSNESVATVADGVITAVGAGTATITVTTADGNKTATCSVTVQAAIGETKKHNFTTDGTTSDFFTIEGNLATNKGSVTYNGLELTQCLKMESSTSITFKATAKSTLTLVFGGTTSASGKKVKVDGTTYTADSNGIVTVDVAAGSHTITKGDSINLFYIVLETAQQSQQ